MQESLKNLLINLQDPESHLDCDHIGAEHDDEEGTHWYDTIVELLVPEGSSCDDLYTSTCADLINLGCSDPCDEPNSQHISDHTWYSIGQKCFIDVSFTAEEAGAIQKFYEECEDCMEMVLDVTFSVPDDIIEEDSDEAAVGENQKSVTWGLKKLQKKDHSTPDKMGDYNFDRDYTVGSGVRIYVLDTGFDAYWRTNAEFENKNGGGSRVEAGMSFIKGETVEDRHGHGTHCAGTAAGNTFGVAAGATVIPIKVLSDTGNSESSEIIEGIEWAKNDCNGRKCVLSMSLGGSKDRVLNDAIDAMRYHNIPVVVAAGNQGSRARGFSPASSDYAITVGSVDRYMRMSEFSNYGEDVDIFAPGSHITSTYKKKSTKSISGTSMACPHVSGLVAMMLSNGDATADRDSIMSQLENDYGTKNDIKSIDTRSPNLFAQMKYGCSMTHHCSGCEINSSERRASNSYSLQQCKDACMNDPGCYGIDVGKNGREGECWMATQQTSSTNPTSKYDGYLKKCGPGVSEEALGYSPDYWQTMDAVNVASEYVAVDVLINGLAFVGVASLFYLGMNACKKQYQPIAEAAEV